MTGAVAGILGVVAQIAEDRQNEQQQIGLCKACGGRARRLLCLFRQSLRRVHAPLQGFEAVLYGDELVAMDEVAKGLTQHLESRSWEQGNQGEICRAAAGLMEVAQTSCGGG